MRTTVMAALLTSLVGCATPQEFRPTERVTGSSAGGERTAEYDMATEAGALGGARLWSEGAFRRQVGGQERTILHVVLELENTGAEPMVVEDLELAFVRIDHERWEGIRALSVEGPDSIPPRQRARLHAYFMLPTEEAPDDVSDFQVRWAVRNGELVYRQDTPFIQEEPPSAYTYGDPFGYPYGGPYNYRESPSYRPFTGPYGIYP